MVFIETWTVGQQNRMRQRKKQFANLTLIARGNKCRSLTFPFLALMAKRGIRVTTALIALPPFRSLSIRPPVTALRIDTARGVCSRNRGDENVGQRVQKLPEKHQSDVGPKKSPNRIFA